METPRIECGVVRPRRERRAIVVSNLSPRIELSPVGLGIVSDRGCGRSSEESPTKGKECYETQADLVPVDRRDHLGLLSTT
jgi:hypothetical protein